MAVNKVVYGDKTLIDLSATTAVASSIMKGFGCFGKDGNWIDGTASQSGGGLPSGISAFDFGEINVTSAFTTTRQTYNHKLGVVPDMMMVWADGNIAQTYSMLFAIRSNQMGYRSSAYNNYYGYHGNSTTTVTMTNSNSTSYGISNMTASTFQLASSSSSYYWRTGTYKYIAIQFS